MVRFTALRSKGAGAGSRWEPCGADPAGRGRHVLGQSPKHPEPEGGPVSSRRVPILVIAVVIAVMTALATFKYVSKADERALGDAQPVAVYVVKKDVPKGFSGARALDEGYIAKEEIPKKFYPANAV